MYHKESRKVTRTVKGLIQTCVCEGVLGVGSGVGFRK